MASSSADPGAPPSERKPLPSLVAPDDPPHECPAALAPELKLASPPTGSTSANSLGNNVFAQMSHWELPTGSAEGETSSVVV
jgi:hypothetical protein